jgi:hypothetical protein
MCSSTDLNEIHISYVKHTRVYIHKVLFSDSLHGKLFSIWKSKISIFFMSYPHEDGGSIFLQNTVEYSPGYMASDFRG